ncbi:MAG TPA: mobile mystery protein B [Chlamydiales bacterium]|nr:mobile mystery protein B [Chlamydiales bacterium]
MRFEFPEGATPLSDSSDLLIDWVQNMEDLNRVEAENIAQAQLKYLRRPINDPSSWFRYSELQTIHRAMFGKVWDWAGKPRKSVTSIGITPGLISVRMAEFCEEVTSWSKEPIELTFLEKSARVHHCLVQIHPFENGNGRFSRLVADRCLLSWKCPHPTWPDNLYRKGITRQQYIESLKAADKYDYRLLVAMMKDLGAADPDLGTLFQDHFYRSYIDGSRGLAKIRALLRTGGNPNDPTANGHRALQLAIRAKIDHRTKFEILKLLIEQGAEVDRSDKSNLTPFQVAVSLGEKDIATFLRSRGARPLAPPGTGYAKYYNLFQQLPPN